MAAEIWDNYIVVLGEGSDIALEDGPGACEAMELSRRGQVDEQGAVWWQGALTKIRGVLLLDPYVS